jgi:hypothetical protein
MAAKIVLAQVISELFLGLPGWYPLNPKNALEIFPLLSPNKISFHNRNSSAAENFIVRSAGATHTCNTLKSLHYLSTNLNTPAPAVGNKNLIVTVVKTYFVRTTSY